MNRVALAFVFALGLAMTAPAAEKTRPITVEDMFQIARVSDPQVSPDGKLVVYAVGTPDLEENKVRTALWLAPTDGGAPRQLTAGTKSDRHPRFSPDGKQILFESNRSGDFQLWVIDLDGGEARQLTTIASEANGAQWSPDGKSIVFVSAVWPENSTKPFAEANAAHKARVEATEKNPVKARVVTKLFYRHWDSWVEDKRQHLFVIPSAGGEPRNLTPGDRDANPTSSTFSAGDDFTFSPDSRYVLFTAPAQKDEAWNTNHDIWRVPLAGGEAQNLTAGNEAADGYPQFSPDGKWLAYRAQRKPGFEADRWELMLVAANGNGKPRSLTEKFDHSIEQFLWGADNRTIYFLAEDQATTPIFQLALDKPEPKRVIAGGAYQNLSLSRDGKVLAAARSSMRTPPEVVVIDPAGQIKSISHANDALLAELQLPTPESVTVDGAGGTPMQMWILKPPGFDPKQKWPLVYLVHGGPQGAWTDAWSFRWNPQIWAAQGYVIALPNPRGSTGFGQQYVNEISGDWGGKCFQDLQAGITFLEAQPYIDRSRMAAAGASFGGYMMNWFEGHTDVFRTLICHCGVYNFDSMYASTEELWFDEWEHGGPPWGRRESYEKHSPHRFAQNFKTPMLIVHNDLDFRVPVSEGHQLFTTLQRLGVPSKLINFPDEGHWVLKPANSRFWHDEVFGWLKQYCPPGGK